jgi:gentisate 1,2-dioxygenase
MIEVAPSLSRAEEFDCLRAELHKRHLFEFWDESYSKDEHIATKRITVEQNTVAHVWSYKDDIEPLLLRSAELIDIHESERRSILMVNPGYDGTIATLATILAAYRINLPNEIAPAHRHTPNAIRFGLTGTTNFTAVEGEHIVFGPGDLVLTPRNTWHNHGNGGDAGAVNFSLLDWPLTNLLALTNVDYDYAEAQGVEKVRRETQTDRFGADYSRRVYGQGGLTPRFANKRVRKDHSPMYVYRYDAVRSMIEEIRDMDGTPHDGIFIEYTDPISGGAIYPTLSFGMQLIRPGERLLAQRQTANRIFLVYEGNGHSIVRGERHDWKCFDTLCVPSGAWCEHRNDSAEDVLLFVTSDEPAIRSLGFLQKLGRTSAGDIVELA